MAQSGPGLAFIVYPEVVTKMSFPNFWAILFFSMLITLALGSIFGAFETILAALGDQIPVLQEHKSKLVLSISMAMFLLGLPFTCGGGIHMFTVFNSAAPSWNLLLFAFLEVICVGWIYSAGRAMKNLEEMNISLNWAEKAYWILCWKFITPALIAILLVMSWLKSGSIQLEGYVYPLGVQILGWFITGGMNKLSTSKSIL